MIKLIVGNKGTGKTKILMDMANTAVKETLGKVVFIEKGLKLTYDVDHAARLIDIEDYDVASFDALFGFLVGMHAGNYDVTEIFVDATLKIGGRDFAALSQMLERLAKVAKATGFTTSFSISADRAELPESIQQYIVN